MITKSIAPTFEHGGNSPFDSEPFSPPLIAKQALDAVQQAVSHAISDPFLGDSRDFYGTRGDAEVILVNDGPIEWPAGLVLGFHGIRLRFAPQSADGGISENRKLGIRLEKLDLKAPSPGLLSGNIELMLTNVGGSRNGNVMGGCIVYYAVRKDGESIISDCAGMLDP